MSRYYVALLKMCADVHFQNLSISKFTVPCFKMRWSIQQAAAGCDPMRNPVHQLTGSNCGPAKELMCLGSIIQQGSGALFSGKDRGFSESVPEATRNFTHG